MQKFYYYPSTINENARIMLFVDGENLANDYQRFIKAHKLNADPVWNTHRENSFLWREDFAERSFCPPVWRTHYYTSVTGDDECLAELIQTAKMHGIEAPRIFKKPRGDRRKQVDIQLTTDMLLNAARRNYDVAILVSNDQDFIPVIRAVQQEGRLVILWHFGTAAAMLTAAADYNHNIAGMFTMSRILAGTVIVPGWGKPWLVR